jgi:hypothetical protein
VQLSPRDEERISDSGAEMATSTGAVAIAGGLLRTVRPHQWVKNLFVFAPVFFARNFFQPDMLLRAASAVFVFCLLSGAVYTLNDLLDDAPRPAIVWGRFREDLDRIEALAKRRKERCGRIDGSVTGSSREAVIRDFAAGKVKILAANPAAAGMGLDLSRAEVQVYYSCAWSHEQRAQSEARSEGPKRTNGPAPIYDLEAVIGGKKTVDGTVLDALELKSHISALVMGDLARVFGRNPG